ncbi:hypothetical protein QPK31_25240 [Massilia sp. YIM B02769]|nr:hypothetical protein [Massilia sp. YIM B02769]MDN4061533.1 hypothetical protein [Massilia sp. YIM B02769]
MNGSPDKKNRTSMGTGIYLGVAIGCAIGVVIGAWMSESAR